MFTTTTVPNLASASAAITQPADSLAWSDEETLQRAVPEAAQFDSPARDLDVFGARVAIVSVLLGAVSVLAALGVVALDDSDGAPPVRSADAVIERVVPAPVPSTEVAPVAQVPTSVVAVAPPTRVEAVVTAPRVAPVVVAPPIVVSVPSTAAAPPAPPVTEHHDWKLPIWHHDWKLPDWDHHDDDPEEDDVPAQ
jgi:hypothetical protein